MNLTKFSLYNFKTNKKINFKLITKKKKHTKVGSFSEKDNSNNTKK